MNAAVGYMPIRTSAIAVVPRKFSRSIDFLGLSTSHTAFSNIREQPVTLNGAS
jgi:hypothetical protein